MMIRNQAGTTTRRFATLLLLTPLVQFAMAQQGEHEKCFSALSKADKNKNNKLSTSPEYVDFLNDFTDFQYGFTSYDDLPVSLQMNYEIYEDSSGVIDITGATSPEEASTRQKRVTEVMCKTTEQAIDAIPYLEAATNSSSELNNTNSLETTNTSSTISNLTNTESAVQETHSYPVENEPEPAIELEQETVPQSQPQPPPQPIQSDTSMTANTTATALPANETIVTNSNFTVAPETVSNAPGNLTESESEPESSASLSSSNSTFTPEVDTNTTNGTSVTQPPTSITTPVVTPAPSTASPTTLTPSTTPPSTIPPSDALNNTEPALHSNISMQTSATTSNTSASEPFTNTTKMISPAPGDAPVVISNTSASSPINSSVTSPDPASTSSPVLSTNTTETENEEKATSAVLTSPTETPTEEDPYSRCKTVIEFSDIDEDGAMNSIEYVWFINDNWKNPFPGVDFTNLPQALKDNFDRLANDGSEIDISYLVSQGDISEEQEQMLNNICSETEAALSQEPTADNAGEEATMSTFKDCLVSVTLFDTDSDTWLTRSEYVALIKEISKGKFGKGSFDTLPDILQANFFALALGSSIDLGGAKHGKKLKSSQQELLEEICVETSYALSEAAQAIGEEEEFDNADTNTMLEYGECFMGMTTSDKDENAKLDEAEYMGLINHMGKNSFHGLTFSELPKVLQDNFLNLETNGAIDISGSQAGQVPTKEQQHFLGKVCIETTAAVNMGLEYLSLSPVTSSSETGPLIIHSSFNIYSEVWLSDLEFITGPARESLDEAFRQFAMEVVDGLKQDGESQSTTQRNLQEDEPRKEDLISFVSDSAEIYKIIDLSCTAAADNAICKTVFAQYEILLTEDMDRQALYDEYVMVTQRFIDSGLLQGVLARVDPESKVSIIGASEPVVFEAKTPTTAPATFDFQTAEDNQKKSFWTSKKKTLALCAIGVGCLLLASLFGLVYIQHRKHHQNGSGRNSTDNSMAKANDTESHEDDFLQEGSQAAASQASQRTPNSSSIFRTRRGDTDSSDDDEVEISDEELGRMQVIDLQDGMMSTVDAMECMNNVHMSTAAALQQGSHDTSSSHGADSFRSFPPLRRKKEKADELSSAASEELSFAFRRYSIKGGKKKSHHSNTDADDSSSPNHLQVI